MGNACAGIQPENLRTMGNACAGIQPENLRTMGNACAGGGGDNGGRGGDGGRKDDRKWCSIHGEISSDEEERYKDMPKHVVVVKVYNMTDSKKRGKLVKTAAKIPGFISANWEEEPAVLEWNGPFDGETVVNKLKIDLNTKVVLVSST